MTNDIIAKVQKKQKKWLEQINSAREMILANLSMISQIPAQTFHEKDRAQFMLSRFTESGVVDPKTDKLHNAIGQFNGNPNTKTVLISTHMDNQFDTSIDQNISITEDRAYGAGVADDNLGVAVLLTLPDILQKLQLEIKSNIILLGTTRFHGRGDFEGIRHFIKTYPHAIDRVININGISLGDLNYFTLSRSRCDIKCEMPVAQDSPFPRMRESSAILVINDIIDSLFCIPLPKKPRTVLNIGMISGGERYSTLSREATINLEMLSEDDSLMNDLIEEINNRCIDIGAKHGADITADFFGRLQAADLTSGHPLVKTAMNVIRNLNMKPRTEYENSEIAVSLAEDIPSVSLGITTGVGGSNSKSYIDIDQINIGILQLIMLLKAIDMGDNNYE